METWYEGYAIHTANIIKNWFDENGPSLADWLPYSRDFNPIEHG
jgi:hypothetical protein